jgi:hypothetical protein
MKILQIIKWGLISFLITLCISQQLRINEIKKRNIEQHIVIMQQAEQIAELLQRKTYNYQFEVKLSVTDKSTYKINGKNNSGLFIPVSEKNYSIKIDSTSFIKLYDNIE